MEEDVALEPEGGVAEAGAGPTEKKLRPCHCLHSNRTALGLCFLFYFFFFFTLVSTPTLCCPLSDLLQQVGGCSLDSAPFPTDTLFIGPTGGGGPSPRCCPFILIQCVFL